MTAREWKARFAAVKAHPIPDLLAQLGHHPVKERHGEQWYLSPFREETDASFKVSRDGRLWYDFGEGVGGDIISFVCQYFDMNKREALMELERRFGEISATDAAPSPAALRKTQETGQKAPKIEMTAIQPVTSWSLKDYLRERGIPPKTALPYLQELHYRRDGKAYFALAFANDSGDYELRNPWYKGVLGHKDISIIKPQEASVNGVAIFEGFMDFLSAIVVAGQPPQMPVIVMNSTALRDRTIEAVRELGAETVYLYLDHDAAGRRLSQEFQEQLPECTVLDRAEIYSGYKDLNAWLVSRKIAAKNTIC